MVSFLFFWAVTIFYATRLTLFFKNFRDGRDAVEILIRDLSVTVDKAQASIGTMKQEAQKSEQALREVVNEAKFIADELRFMNESGDGLAGRLEKLADRNRELLDLLDDAGGIGSHKIDIPKDVPAKKTYKKKPRPVERDAFPLDDEDEFDMDKFDLDAEDEADFLALAKIDGETDLPSVGKEKAQPPAKEHAFSIFDRDHAEEPVQTQPPAKQKKSKPEKQERFYSRAEQDLYDALQRRKRVKENT